MVLTLLLPAGASGQAAAARAAQVTATSSADTVSAGQPFVVALHVRAPKSAIIKFPALPDSTDAIEPMDPLSTNDTPDDALLDRTASYRVAAWDVGRRVPHFAPVVVTVAGVSVSYEVTVPAVFVLATLPADSTLQIARDARDPMSLPTGLWRLWVVLAIVGGLSYAYMRQQRVRPPNAPKEPDAFVVASAAFRALEELALADAGEHGRHVIAHTDVLRTYLARRFPEAVASLTVVELHRVLARADFPVLPERLATLLDRDEDVRFAESVINRADAVMLAAEARAIVRDVETAHAERQRVRERGPQRPARR